MQDTDALDLSDADLYLRAVRVVRMEVIEPYGWMTIELDADGLPQAVAAMQSFFNASWLGDLDLPYLGDLLDLPNHEGGVSLREEGWASWEPGHGQARVCASYGDAPCALIAWEEFRAALQLKRDFLCLMRQYEGRGIPRYSRERGFRVRLSLGPDRPQVNAPPGEQ
jgi:hypothetical protein